MLDKSLLELKPAYQQDDRGSGSHRKQIQSSPHSQLSRAATSDSTEFSSAGNLISGREFWLGVHWPRFMETSEKSKYSYLSGNKQT